MFDSRNENLKPMCWRRPTLALRLPSAQTGLTAVFGMRTGVTPSPNHQHITFKFKDQRKTNAPHLFYSLTTEEHKAGLQSNLALMGRVQMYICTGPERKYQFIV